MTHEWTLYHEATSCSCPLVETLNKTKQNFCSKIHPRLTIREVLHIASCQQVTTKLMPLHVYKTWTNKGINKRNDFNDTLDTFSLMVIWHPTYGKGLFRPELTQTYSRVDKHWLYFFVCSLVKTPMLSWIFNNKRKQFAFQAPIQYSCSVNTGFGSYLFSLSIKES